MTTLRMMLRLVAKENLELVQLDVKTAFLHGDLDEEIYMAELEGFAKHRKEHRVCRLKKSLIHSYNLKGLNGVLRICVFT